MRDKIRLVSKPEKGGGKGVRFVVGKNIVVCFEDRLSGYIQDVVKDIIKYDVFILYEEIKFNQTNRFQVNR